MHALTTGSYAQAHATPLPDAPDTQKPVAGVAQNTKPPSLDGREARLALLSQISSKSPIGASFMAKLEDPVAVEGKPVLPMGTLVEGHLETIPAPYDAPGRPAHGVRSHQAA